MKEFLAMGGYAFYVWTSFGLTFVVMAAIALGSLSSRRKAIEAVKRAALVAKNRAAESRSSTQPNSSPTP